MKWQFSRTNIICGMLAFLGIVQFICSLLVAIRLYPGGYSIGEEFLSDLGRTVTIAGLDNVASASYFNRSIILLGMSLIPFFIAMPAVLENGRWLVRTAGVLSALGLIGIGLTPYDRHLAAHLLALGLWIAPMLVTVIGFSVSAELSGRNSTVLLFGSVSVVLAFCAYMLIESHRGHVLFQKVFVALAAVWFCLVLVYVSISTVQSITSRRSIVERQARRYLRVIQRRHRR